MAQNKEPKHQCEEMVWDRGGWHRYQCRNKAKVEYKGKWYCGIHDPVRIEQKRKEHLILWATIFVVNA